MEKEIENKLIRNTKYIRPEAEGGGAEWAAYRFPKACAYKESQHLGMLKWTTHSNLSCPGIKPSVSIFMPGTLINKEGRGQRSKKKGTPRRAGKNPGG